MVTFQYQLVIQFDASTVEDFDSLIEIEDAVETALSNSTEAKLDGHDFGLGEFNIFIHTNEPKTCLAIAGDAIEAKRPGTSYAAGYRSYGDDCYTPIWPPTAKSFSVS